MNNLLQVLSFVLPIIASLSVLIVLGINLYLKIRRSFPAKVNCWFCNEWTKVHYDLRNSFECPTCLQYNGFDDDGAYNKIIPAQHDELLNYQIPMARKKSDTNMSNSLCRVCNNNQQLKIYQLANFVPLNEDNFDAEVELFRLQLEKSYKLCSTCDHIVKKTITQQSKWLLGLKLSNLKKQSLSLFDLQNSFNGLTKESKRTYFLLFINTAIIILALLVVLHAVYYFDASNVILNKYFRKYVSPYLSPLRSIFMFAVNSLTAILMTLADGDSYKILETIYVDMYVNILNIKHLLMNVVLNNGIIDLKQFFNFTKLFRENIPEYLILKRLDVTCVCVSGLLLQIVASFLSQRKMSVKALQVSIWVLLTYTSLMQPLRQLGFLVNLLQITVAIVIICTTRLKDSQHSKAKKLLHASSSRRKSSRKSKINSKNSSNEDVDLPQQNKSKHSSFISLDSVFKSSLSAHDTTDTAESDCSITSTSTKKTTNHLSSSTCRTNHIFGQAAIFGDGLNKSPVSFEELNTSRSAFADSFVTARSTASTYRDNFNSQTKTCALNDRGGSSPTKNYDLNQSLDNLHLGAFNPGLVDHPVRDKPSFVINTDVTRPRPILSPPRLKTINQNSWTAGGFWKIPQAPNLFVNTDISRSSSQSSGFVSQCNEPLSPLLNKFNSLPPSRNNSIMEEHDKFSLVSEPPYHYTGNFPQQQFCEIRSYHGPATKFNTKGNKSIVYSDLFYKHTNPEKFFIPQVKNLGNFDSFKQADSIANFNAHTASINKFKRNRVQSLYCPVTVQENVSEQRSNFGNCSSNTSGTTSNNEPCSNKISEISRSFCNPSVEGVGTYKKGSLFKSLDGSVCNS